MNTKSEDAEEAKLILEDEGIGYAVLHYCGPDHFKDTKLQTLWAKARYALEELNAYVFEGREMTAEERGQMMMWIPIPELPKLARDFAKKLNNEVGMCGEVLLTAWIVYAQCVEGLKCSDDLYLARPQDIKWFKERMEKE